MAFSWIRSGEVLSMAFLLPYTSMQDLNETFPALQPCQGQDFNGSNHSADLRSMGQKVSEQAVVWR